MRHTGERVIYAHPDPAYDGRTGQITCAYEGLDGTIVYDVAFDTPLPNGKRIMRGIWASKLDDAKE